MTAAKARRLFGTDGIRAVAGETPLDPTTIFACGLALGHSLHTLAAEPKVILGRDTRESSPWIAATLAAGLREAGARVESAGVITTPAVAFLARTHGFQAGVVISASHNPWQDNGIKLFGGDGFKLADAVELAMEDEILQQAAKINPPDPASLPPVADNPAFLGDYIQFLIDAVPGLNLAGLRIVADCANGASAAVAPQLFRRLSHEGRILDSGGGNNTGCQLNFRPRMDPARLVEGYRSVLNRIYSADAYYERVRLFLSRCNPQYQRNLNLGNVRAMVLSILRQGVLGNARADYWRFLLSALTRYRRSFGTAMTQAVMGYHFQKVTQQLSKADS